jgi:iron-sulfur cluster insertion protein
MVVRLEFTEKAIGKIKGHMTSEEKMIKLKYETEGCGCVVSGVPVLWIVNHKDEDEIFIETNYKPVLIEKSKMVFFDEEMKIDFVESANCYQLKSPNQYLNPRMSLIEKSGVAHESKA